MASKIYEDIVATLDGCLTLPEDELSIARDKMNAVHGHPIDPDTQASWSEIGGVRCVTVIADNVTKKNRTLLYFRGGAFIAADGDGFLFYAEMLSRHFNSRVIMVDYPLAPQHTFPSALNDCCNAYRGLLDSGTPANTIAFIGDSCGGGLVLTSLLLLRETQTKLPACGISLCGWFDMASNSNVKDPLYHQGYAHKRGLDYAGTIALTNPLISPVFADFDQLPPLLLQTGSTDPTSHHAKIINNKAVKAGTIVELDIAPGMLHGFHGLANLGVPEAIDALARAKTFLEKYIHSA